MRRRETTALTVALLVMFGCGGPQESEPEMSAAAHDREAERHEAEAEVLEAYKRTLGALSA